MTGKKSTVLGVLACGWLGGWLAGCGTADDSGSTETELTGDPSSPDGSSSAPTPGNTMTGMPGPNQSSTANMPPPNMMPTGPGPMDTPPPGAGGAPAEPSNTGPAGNGGSGPGSMPPPPAGMGGMPTEPPPSPPQGSCTFEISDQMSEQIPTVAIVEWSVSPAVVDEAVIEFGLDTSYGLSAPVDLMDPGYRTLLLGMKPAREYHYRIVVKSGAEQCQSEDRVVMTGEAPNDLTRPEITTPLPDQLEDGYMITAFWGNSGKPAFILDKDNDFVWWYPAEDDVFRARMSFDGKSMWLRNTAQLDGSGVVRRVSMDGLNEERWELPTTTHDLAVIPDGNIALIAHADNGCDEIMEFNPETEVLTSVFNLEQAHGQLDCHSNAISYFEPDDAFFVSDWAVNSYIKISRQGELLWVLNGEASDFQGTSWVNQHDLHVLASDHLLIFSNGDSGENSIVYEFMLDESSMTATEIWRYDGGVSATYGGDVQRLNNGNTLVTYSSAGVIHQVNEEQELVQELAWPIGNTVSYSVKRDSLYGGPPPKIYPY